MGTYFVYSIECVELKRQYIGSTNDLKRRYKEHCDSLKENKHYNYQLQDAYNTCKYTFKFKVLERVRKATRAYVLKREQYYIEKYFKTCFNINTVWDESLVSYFPRLMRKRERIAKLLADKQNKRDKKIRRYLKERDALKQDKTSSNCEVISVSTDTLSKLKKITNVKSA